MDNYSNLVNKVLANEHLVKAVRNVDDGNCLNLVAEDWEERLKNNAVYQDFCYSSKTLWKPTYFSENYTFESSKYENFQVIMVSQCKFEKPWNRGGKIPKQKLVVLNSEPLAKIARAMMSDLGSEIQISNDFKFTFNDCGILSCHDCSSAADEFAKAGWKVTKTNQPCILDTKVFDGKSVVNRFHSQVEEIFTDTFFAILRLNINIRYNFWDASKQKSYRISGDILDFVGFTESKLASGRKIDVGLLIHIDDSVEEQHKPSQESSVRNCKLKDDSIKSGKLTGDLKTKEGETADDFQMFVNEQLNNGGDEFLYDEEEEATMSLNSIVGQKRKFEECDNDEIDDKNVVEKFLLDE